MIERNSASLLAKCISVIVVSFGVKEGAENWLKETQTSFKMILDEDRVLYRHFGMKRSIKSVFNSGVLRVYGERKAQNIELPKAMLGIEDDPLQMGGDFTVNVKNGKVIKLYVSKTPHDRPSIQQIMNV